MGIPLLVKPRALHRIADDVDDMATASRKAATFAETYVDRDVGGGYVLTDAGELVKKLASMMADDYPDAAKTLRHGSRLLHELADDYREVDHEAAAEYDRQVKRFDEYYQMRNTPDFDHHSDPGIKQTDVDRVLAEPGNAYDDGWVGTSYDIEDKVTSIIDFGASLDGLSVFGLENPFAGWAEEWDGHWTEFGIACAGIERLGEFWGRLGAEAIATTRRWSGNWEGKAAFNAYYWMSSCADTMLEHGEEMKDQAGEVFANALLLNEAITPVLDVAEDLFDCIGLANAALSELGGIDIDLSDPLGTLGSVFGGLGDSAKKLKDLVEKLAGLIKHAGKVINALRIVGAYLYSAIEDLTSQNKYLYLQMPGLVHKNIRP